VARTRRRRHPPEQGFAPLHLHRHTP
jgi:hypothetical protein